MLFSRSLAALTTALLCACGPVGKELPTSNPTTALAAARTQNARGLSFVESQCSGCHAVHPGVEPPNPQAPSFVAIANDMDFSQDTLREFFRDGHDTPYAMMIQLDEDEAELASSYIMSLRSSR